MKFDILTIFPKIFSAKDGYFATSLMARAQKLGLIKITAHDLRDWASDKHMTARPTERHRSFGRVDDRPYGGGVGMVMKVDVIYKALKALKIRGKKSRVILVTPQGKTFNQKIAKSLAKYERLVFISGRYEGYDDRIRDLVDEEISIGDYVLTGGELPVMVVTDAVARLMPGVVGKAQSLEEESFSESMLEYPHYTRPENFHGARVPKVLLSGNHAKIKDWRRAQALKRTRKRRPDLLT